MFPYFRQVPFNGMRYRALTTSRTIPQVPNLHYQGIRQLTGIDTGIGAALKLALDRQDGEAAVPPVFRRGNGSLGYANWPNPYIIASFVRLCHYSERH